MTAPSPLPFRLGQPSRRELARTRKRLRREARARTRRLPVYPESRIEQRLAVGPRFWRGIRNALLCEAAFVALGLGAWWLL